MTYLKLLISADDLIDTEELLFKFAMFTKHAWD